MLADTRVVVGLPPESSFGGHAYDLACALVGTLQDAGPTVMTVSAEEWDDLSLRKATLARLERFAPHLSLAIPQSGYALRFKTNGGENLFADLLRIPTVLPWDHLLTQAPTYFLAAMYSAAQQAGASFEIRDGLAHPQYKHYVPDSGHITVYEELGLLKKGHARTYMPSADAHFLHAGRARVESAPGKIGFAGNVYLTHGQQLKLLENAFMRQIDEALLEAKRKRWDVSGWHLLQELLDQIPPEFRERNGLTPDYPLFWWLALDLLSYRVTTHYRLSVLEAIDRPVDFYGNFVDPQSSSQLANSGNVTFRGSVPYGSLPELFRQYDVWVDVTNAPFINGCGAKVFNCFAAGSFMLIDYREDVRREVGEIAELFMYRTADELREKVAYYLDRATERLEIVDAMQAIIRERFTWKRFYGDVCADVTAFSPACSN